MQQRQKTQALEGTLRSKKKAVQSPDDMHQMLMFNTFDVIKSLLSKDFENVSSKDGVVKIKSTIKNRQALEHFLHLYKESHMDSDKEPELGDDYTAEITENTVTLKCQGKMTLKQSFQGMGSILKDITQKIF